MGTRSIIGRSALGLAIYSLCLVFVCSFILFEVLDVDGSDFPSTATQAVAAEAPHADVRRLHCDPSEDPIVPPIVASFGEPECSPVSTSALARPSPASTSPGTERRLLARASIDDTSPSV
jgi:hypothetical protein